MGSKTEKLRITPDLDLEYTLYTTYSTGMLNVTNTGSEQLSSSTVCDWLNFYADYSDYF